MTDIATNQTEIRNFELDPDEIVANATANSLKQHRDSAVCVNEARAAADATANVGTATNDAPDKAKGTKPMSTLNETAEEHTDYPPNKVPIRERTLDNASTMSIASHGSESSPAMPVNNVALQQSQSQTQPQTQQPIASSKSTISERSSTVYMEPNVPSTQKLFGDRLRTIERTVKTLCSQYEALVNVDQTVSTQDRKIRKKSVSFGEDFAQRGGLEELYSKAREPIISHEGYHVARAAYITNQVQPALRQLLGQIELKREELKRSHDGSAKSVNKQRKETRRRVSRLSSIMMRTLSRNSVTPSPKEDPYVVNQGVLHQLDKQLNTESLFQQVAHEREQGLFNFEATITERLKQIITSFLQWDSDHCAEVSTHLSDVRQPMSNISEQDDQTAFIRNRRGSLFDPTASPIIGSQVYYKNRDSTHVQPIQQGPLMYRMANGNWNSGKFVISPIGYLHCFSESSSNEDQMNENPIYSLRLDQCVVGPYGTAITDPFSWTVTEQEKGGLLHRRSIGGANNRVVTFRAANEQTMLGWWNNMTHISHGEPPITVAPNSFGGGAAEQLPANAAANQLQPLPVSDLRENKPYEESPTLPEDSPFVNASTQNANVNDVKDGSTSALKSPAVSTGVIEGPVVRYPQRTSQSAHTPNTSVPLAVGGRFSPNPFGVSNDKSNEAQAKTAKLSPSGRTRPLSQLAAIDSEFPEYTKGLTCTQKQHIGDILVGQGKEAAMNAAHTLDVSAIAATAGKRRLVNNEPTKIAADHVTIEAEYQDLKWNVLPFCDELIIPYGTLDNMLYKQSMKNVALLGHLKKRKQSEKALAKSKLDNQLPLNKQLSTQELQEELPFYYIDLSEEQHWGTFNSLKRHRKRTYKPVLLSFKRLQHQLPFYNVDLYKEHPWGTFVSTGKQSKKLHKVMPDMKTQDAIQLHELPFYDVDLYKEHPWGTFVSTGKQSKKLHKVMPDMKTQDAIQLHELPFYNVDLYKEHPWGTFVSTGKRDRKLHKVMPDMKTQDAIQLHELPFYNVDLYKEHPWGTFVSTSKRSKTLHKVMPDMKTQDAIQLHELPFYNVDLYKEHPWGTFVSTSKRSKTLHKLMPDMKTQDAIQLHELPFYNVDLYKEHPWGTFVSTGKRDRKLHKVMPDMKTQDAIQLHELPFYDVDLYKEHPWGTFVSTGKRSKKLHKLMPDMKTQDAIQLHELPFYDVDLYKEHPWGTFVSTGKRDRKLHKVMPDMKTQDAIQLHELPFYDVDLYKEHPWGTFVSTSKRSKTLHKVMPDMKTQDAIQLHELPFYDVDLYKEHPWGTFVSTSKRSKTLHKVMPDMRRQDAIQLHELPFYNVNLDKEQPWGTFSHSKKLCKILNEDKRHDEKTYGLIARKTPLTTAQLNRELAFYGVDLENEQPWGTFIYRIRPRHSVHSLRRARAMDKHSRRNSLPKIPLGSARLEKELAFHNIPPNEDIPYGTLKNYLHLYFSELDKMFARVGREAAQQIHSTDNTAKSLSYLHPTKSMEDRPVYHEQLGGKKAQNRLSNNYMSPTVSSINKTRRSTPPNTSNQSPTTNIRKRQSINGESSSIKPSLRSTQNPWGDNWQSRQLTSQARNNKSAKLMNRFSGYSEPAQEGPEKPWSKLSQERSGMQR
ncbi:hypothetical protein BDF19DRAFT_488012 [Syncephalis fuscata]|nr:hypothetical protein BDF19DRAFT_488012 [Syncephalis fuscata]